MRSKPPLAFLALTALALLVLPRPASSAPIMFEGQTVQLTYHYPDVTTNHTGPFNAVVGAGVEVTNFAGHAYDFSDTNILVDYGFSGTWIPAAFNGFQVFDVNGTIPAILSVTVNSATNLVGLDASRITFDANNIFVNWQGLSFTTDTIVSLDVKGAPAAVPEPASLLLLGTGLAGAGLRRWRQKRV